MSSILFNTSHHPHTHTHCSRLNNPSSLGFSSYINVLSLNHLYGLMLDLLQYVMVSFVLGSLKLDTVLQVWHHQCWGEGPAPSTCWWCYSAHSPGGCCPLLQGHIAGSCWTCPPGYPGSFLHSYFPAPVCTGAWNYSSGLDISLCWTISPACRVPSKWQHNCLAYQPLPHSFPSSMKMLTVQSVP